MKSVEVFLILCFRGLLVIWFRTVAVRCNVRLSILVGGSLFGRNWRAYSIAIFIKRLLIVATSCFAQSLSLDVSLLVHLSCGGRFPKRLLLYLLMQGLSDFDLPPVLGL